MAQLRHSLIMIAGLSLLLAACGSSGGSSTSNRGLPAEESFAGIPTVFVQRGCIACHAVETGEDRGLLGPSMVGVASRSAETITLPDYTGSAESEAAYLRESIVNPEIYIAAGYEALMPNTYEAILSDQEITELVNYMLTFD